MNTSDKEDKNSSPPSPPTKEQMDNLYRDYELVFGLFKLDVDIHYRRAQMMLALQAALLAGFYLKGLEGGF